MSNVLSQVKSILNIGILEFARMCANAKIRSVSDAIAIIHKNHTSKDFFEPLVKDAYKYLYERDLKEATFTDEEGNKFTVSMYLLTEKVYDDTPELLAALEAEAEAKEHVKKVKETTPFQTGARGELGYCYKVITAKPTKNTK